MPYQDWEQQTAFLNDYQLKDPVKLLLACSNNQSLFFDRLLLFELFYAAIGSRPFRDHSESEISDHLQVFERLVTILEANAVMCQLISQDQLIYSYKNENPG